MTTTQLYTQIEGAARQVESQIQKDNNFPDLRDLLGTQSHVSGDYSTNPTHPKPILQKIDVIPLPSSLNSLYARSMFPYFLYYTSFFLTMRRFGV